MAYGSGMGCTSLDYSSTCSGSYFTVWSIGIMILSDFFFLSNLALAFAVKREYLSFKSSHYKSMKYLSATFSTIFF